MPIYDWNVETLVWQLKLFDAVVTDAKSKGYNYIEMDVLEPELRSSIESLGYKIKHQKTGHPWKISWRD